METKTEDPVSGSHAFADFLLPSWRKYGSAPNKNRRVHVSLPKDRPPDCLVVLFHGQTHSGSAILRAARDEIRSLMPGAAIIAPDGYYSSDPDQHIRTRKNPAQRGFSWFDMPDSNSLPGRFFPALMLAKSLRPSIDYSHQLIDQYKEKFSLPESSVYLIGFSQGGGIASQVGIERKERCAGIANICGMFFDPHIFGMKKPVSRPPYFYGYDMGDEIMPDWIARHTLTTLKLCDINALVHITPAGPTQEMTIHDHRGRAHLEVRPTPGAPRTEMFRHARRDEHGKLQITYTEHLTGHYLNAGMKASLLHALRHVNEDPLPEAPELGATHLFGMLTMRVDLDRLRLGWMIMPKRERSTLPHQLRPLSAWQRKVYRAKRSLSGSFNSVARRVMRIASPLLFDLPDQIGEELRGRNKLTHLFSAAVLSTARVLIPKIFDLPPHLAERLNKSGNRNEEFVDANTVHAMMEKSPLTGAAPVRKRPPFWKRLFP